MPQDTTTPTAHALLDLVASQASGGGTTQRAALQAAVARMQAAGAVNVDVSRDGDDVEVRVCIDPLAAAAASSVRWLLVRLAQATSRDEPAIIAELRAFHEAAQAGEA